MNNIRNFLITAHIDHGKSTLADRLLEETRTVEKRHMQAQYLDSMELERERGITIKMAPVRMEYTHKGERYILNLIDTPGHSDFGYEVSRALAAVEGAVLLVDATQGIQAQTLYNYEMARKAGLKIIGVVNKVDITDEARVVQSIHELAVLIGVEEDEIIRASGKTGIGISDILTAIIERVPPPRPVESYKLKAARALIFDSFYDDHKGVIAYVRVFSGSFVAQNSYWLAATRTQTKTKEIGHFRPSLVSTGELKEGEIGYIATGIKDPGVLKIGDTITDTDPSVGGDIMLAGYKEPRPVVFVSFYPEYADDYDDLKKALGRLKLSDAAIQFEPDQSEVLGRGFKGGFLGQLHFEIASERILREFDIPIVSSFPTVAYKVKVAPRYTMPKEVEQDGEYYIIKNPKDFPTDVIETLEPITRIEILTPLQYLGAILQLKDMYRIANIETTPMGAAADKMLITAELPLADLISDFDDKLKSVSQGYGSLSYEVVGYKHGDLDKLEIVVAEHVVPGLTRILPKEDIYHEGRTTCEKLKELLPKQQFPQAIQAQHRGRIIARETISALKKDLGNFGKNGGDRTRKMKLWKKQARGKERLKERGVQNSVYIPANVFKELLKK